MSPAYNLFEVTNNCILPEYLEDVFMGEEFDRDASFYAMGGVRGALTWQEFCDIEIPVPQMKVQQEIILNKRMITLKTELVNLLEATSLTKTMLLEKIAEVVNAI